MAKQATFTVNVQNTQQFQAFVTQFNNLSAQIQGLTQTFTNMTNAINKTTTSTNALTSSMRVLSNITKSLLSTVGSITKHFVSWHTLIGGITALMALGGGLFGIDRLAVSILQRRRMILGLGGDFGRTQASLIANQSLLGNPQDVLSNIRLGTGGAPDQLRALLSMGIPFGTKMSPDEILGKIIEKIPSLLAGTKPGTELLVLRAYGLDKIFQDPLDLLRLTTKEGQELAKQNQQLIAQHKKDLELTPQAQRAMSEFAIQLQIAKYTVLNAFGESLKVLTPALTHLSQAFSDLVRRFMQSEIVQKMLRQLSKWLDALAVKLQKFTEKDFEKWMTTLEGLLKALKEFWDILVKIISWFTGGNHALFGDLFKPRDGDGGGGGGGYPGSRGSGNGGYSGGTTDDKTPTLPKTPSPVLPYSIDPGPAGPGGLPPGFSFKPNVPTLLPDTFSTGAGPFSFDTIKPKPAVPDVFTTGPGPFSFGPVTSPAGATPSLPHASSSGAGSTPPLPHGRPGGAPGGRSLPRGVVPPTIPGGSGGDTIMVPAVPGQHSMRGPGSMDQWQHTRVANLVVRNVPGANTFLTAQGMST